jgi:hypothetical protein
MNIDNIKRYVIRNSKYSDRFGEEIYSIKMPLDNPNADTYSAKIRKHCDVSNTKMYKYNSFMYSFDYVCKRIFNDYKKGIIKFTKERA